MTSPSDPKTPADRATEDTRRHEDLSQDEVVEDGMQGATGSADASGLDPQADLGEKLEELQRNMQSVTGQKE